MEQYQERVYWQIRRMIGTHEESNDVVQECFVKVYRHISKFKGDSALSSWIYRIAANEALTFLRKQQRRATDSLDDHQEVVRDLSDDGYFDETQALAVLHQAVQTLPAKQRQVFMYRYYEEMSYREMAEITETSEGSLKASYHHAVKKVENYIKNQLNS